MGVFEENKKKRQEYVDLFERDYEVFCCENRVHHHDDVFTNLSFNGNENYYLSSPESLLGWYLSMYEGEEYRIPEILVNDYDLEITNKESMVSEALELFYQTTCNLKESLEVNDFMAQEYENGKGKYLRFYFRTSNKMKEFEDLVPYKDDIRAVCESTGEEFNENEFNEEIYITIYGDFYENGDTDLYLESNHYLLDKEKTYNLMECLSREDVDAFWCEVKKTEEWKEFEESFEIEKER